MEYLCYLPLPPPDAPGDTHREFGGAASVQKERGRKEVQLEPWRYVGMAVCWHGNHSHLCVCAGHVVV